MEPDKKLAIIVMALASLVFIIGNVSAIEVFGSVPSSATVLGNVSNDTIPPFIQILQPSNNSVFSIDGLINISFIVNATDNVALSSYWYSINGDENVTFNNGTVGIYLQQPDGTTRDYLVRMYVNDTSNNINSTSVFITVHQTSSPGAGSGSGGGSGGGAGGVNETEPEEPEEPSAPEGVLCGAGSIQEMGVCLSLVGDKIWPNYPNIGLIILVIFFYIILLLLIYNRNKIPLFKDFPVYLKIIFGIVLFIVSVIIFIWLFSSCKVEKLGDVGSCVLDFGNRVWPGNPVVGVTILFILIGIIFILILLYKRREKKRQTKRRSQTNVT